MADVLYPIIESCENLFVSLGTLEEKNRKYDIILDHIKSCTEKRIQIGDFKNNLEWFNVSHSLSLKKELLGKVVVLDFFTYCCINCLHILPALKELEKEYSIHDGLVVVGVHSAKFDNEKDSANILSAIQRYNITHPVVNDMDGTMWHDLSIPCWPTLLILGPSSEALFLLIGESHKSDVLMYIQCAMKYFSNSGKLQSHSLPLAPSYHVAASRSLCFPGKVAYISAPANSNDATSVNNNSNKLVERLAVSDTGNHRVIIFTTSGKVEHRIGGHEPGLRDGSFEHATFNSPQGVVFRSIDVLYVADTGNHAIREVNLKSCQVVTIFQQENCSPWDLCLASSSILKNINPLQDEDKDVLIIAMAGVHQIWAYFFNTVTWWKGKVYEAGTCSSIAGTGKEENRNNCYPHAAGFAQPSGLTLAPEHQAIFIADSESSSIRKLSLTDGKVSAVVGGSKSPFNLFTFGDKDGAQFEVRLQHPLGVAWNSHDQTLYVADSYNHKIKAVNIQTNTCKTLLQSGNPIEVQLNEPGGLCVTPHGTEIYITDTNNHCLKVISLKNNAIKEVPISLSSGITPLTKKRLGTVLERELRMNSAGGEINLLVSVKLKDGIELTASAPQKWELELPDASWSANSTVGEFTPNTSLRITVPQAKEADHSTFTLHYTLYICVEHSECKKLDFCFLMKVEYCNEAPSVLQQELSHVVS